MSKKEMFFMAAIADAYEVTPYKHTHILKWALKRCNSAPRLMNAIHTKRTILVRAIECDQTMAAALEQWTQEHVGA